MLRFCAEFQARPELPSSPVHVWRIVPRRIVRHASCSLSLLAGFGGLWPLCRWAEYREDLHQPRQRGGRAHSHGRSVGVSRERSLLPGGDHRTARRLLDVHVTGLGSLEEDRLGLAKAARLLGERSVLGARGAFLSRQVLHDLQRQAGGPAAPDAVAGARGQRQAGGSVHEPAYAVVRPRIFCHRCEELGRKALRESAALRIWFPSVIAPFVEKTKRHVHWSIDTILCSRWDRVAARLTFIVSRASTPDTAGSRSFTTASIKLWICAR
jgi:hypothetical protein